MDCDSVIVTIGVIPNLELVERTTIEANRGILVDDRMQTSVPSIYAAGDVTEAPTMLTGDRQVIPTWPDAYEQGKIAGSNMAGQERKYPGGLPMNSIEFFGLPTISVGLSNPKEDGYQALKKYDAKRGTYRKIVLKNNLIVGAIFVGAIDRAGIITGLIKDKINVKNFKKELLEENFGYISFPKELREEKLQV